MEELFEAEELFKLACPSKYDGLLAVEELPEEPDELVTPEPVWLLEEVVPFCCEEPPELFWPTVSEELPTSSELPLALSVTTESV